jgi:hypothetical protein
MTNLTETGKWEPGIYQLETSDPVEGGPDGVDNVQARQLANRTRYLKDTQEAHFASADPHPQYASKSLQTSKADLDSPNFRGAVRVPDAPRGDASTLAANTGFVAAALAAGVQAQGKLNGVNRPNILPNGSGELGNAGWRSANLPAASSTWGDGMQFVNLVPITGGDLLQDFGVPLPCTAGVTLTLSAELYAYGMTRGMVRVRLQALDTAGQPIGDVAQCQLEAGATDWRYRSASGVTPTGTTQVRVIKAADAQPLAPAFGCAVRAIKVEQGPTPSLYAQEANWATVAPLDSPALTGAPSAPTPPLADNGARVATTEFVRRAAGNHAGYLSLSASQTLTSEHLGQFIQLYATNPITLVLPADTPELPPGSVIDFVNGGQGSVTLSPANGNAIYVIGNAPALSPVLASGDSARLVSTGRNTWLVNQGTTQLRYSSAFGAGLAVGGSYQKLPSGLIVQMGTFSGSTQATVIDGISENVIQVNFPIAFPNACFGILATPGDVEGYAQETAWALTRPSRSGAALGLSCRRPNAPMWAYYFAWGQ